MLGAIFKNINQRHSQVISQRHVAEMLFRINEIVQNCKIRLCGIHRIIYKSSIWHRCSVAESCSHMLFLRMSIAFRLGVESLRNCSLKCKCIRIQPQVFVGHLKRDFDICCACKAKVRIILEERGFCKAPTS